MKFYMSLFEKKCNTTVLIIFLIVGIQLLYMLTIPISTFPDTATYEHFNFLSWKAWYGGERPFIYPLFIKLLNTNHLLIVGTQYLFSIIATCYFIITVSKLFKTKAAKLTFLLLLLAYLLSAGFVSFNSCILTESINFSLWITLFSFGIRYLTRQSASLLIGIIFVGFLLSFTKYFNVILIMSLLPLYILILLKIKTKTTHIFLLGLTIIIISSLSLYAMKLSKSSDFSLKNIISTRVMMQRNHSMLNYFNKNGFPEKAVATLNFNKDPFALSHETNLTVTNWIDKKGHNVYVKYLITHPYYFFITPLSSTNTLQYIFGPNTITKNLFHMFWRGTTVNYTSIHLFHYNIWILYDLFVLIMLVRLSLKKLRKKKIFAKDHINKEALYYYLIGIYLLFAGFITAILTWHADSMEVTRHGLLSTFLVFFSLTWLLAIFTETTSLDLDN